MLMTERTRRNLLKIIGTGVASSGIVGVAAGQSDENTSEDGETSPSGPSVEPEALNDWSVRWSPQTIDNGDHSTLKSTWQVTTSPNSPAYHRFDTVVDATMVKQPEVVATDFSDDNIKKDWEYVEDDDRLGGPAYHFKAKKYFYNPIGTELYLDSKIEPTDKGRVEAQSGAYFDPLTNLLGAWSTAYLDVE